MPRILIVDEDLSFRKAVWLALVKLGYEVVEAANGQEAVKLHRVLPADVLMTELVMPEQKGLEIIRAFRLGHRALKIIAIAGGQMGGRGTSIAAKKTGANRAVKEPFSIQELANALNDVALPL